MAAVELQLHKFENWQPEISKKVCSVHNLLSPSMKHAQIRLQKKKGLANKML